MNAAPSSPHTGWYLHGWELPCCWPAGRDAAAAALQTCRVHSELTSSVCSALLGSSESLSPQAEACGSFLKNRKMVFLSERQIRGGEPHQGRDETKEPEREGRVSKEAPLHTPRVQR